MEGRTQGGAQAERAGTRGCRSTARVLTSCRTHQPLSVIRNPANLASALWGACMKYVEPYVALPGCDLSTWHPCFMHNCTSVVHSICRVCSQRAEEN